LIVGSSFGQFQKKSWMVSGAGFFDLGGFNVEEKFQAPIGNASFNMIAGDYLFNTRFAYFVIDKLGIGLDAELDIDGGGMEPDNTAAKNMFAKDYKSYEGETAMFIGPIIRYYIPIGKLVAVFPEASIGYRGYGSIEYSEYKNAAGNKEESKIQYSASGVGFNMGVGIVFKLTKRIGLDFSGRWGGGKISGTRKDKSKWTTASGNTNDPDRDIDIKFANIDLMIGFQVFFGGPKEK
ncbi:hypothetical protein ACFLRY_05345, partial [Bacteroidota bacterium]